MALVVALLVGACASVGNGPARLPADGPFALPGGGGDFLSFGDSTYRMTDADPQSVPAGAGAARGAAMDLRQGFGVVAYQNQVAVVSLSSQEVEWLPYQAEGDWVQVAARDGVATIVSGSMIELFDLVEKRSLWRKDAAGWLKDVGLGRLDGALPISRGGLCLVGSKGSSVFGSGAKVVLQKVDTSTGSWQMSTRTEVAGLSRVDCMSLDGDFLYLSGVYETTQMATGQSMGRLWQDLVVIRTNLADLSLREIVRNPAQERSSSVQQVIAGQDLVALLLGTGFLTVYRLDASGQTSRNIYDELVTGARSIAWVDPQRIVVTTETEERVIQVADR